MDPRASLSLFSRGASPPQPKPDEGSALPPPPHHRPEGQEVTQHQPQPSPVHDIEVLLRGLNNPAPVPPAVTSQPATQPSYQPQSSSDTSSTTQADKQNALLSNLMNPGQSGYSPQSQPPPIPRQNSPQGGASDSQGKMLLEQLMAGSAQSESQPSYSPHSQRQSSSEVEPSYPPQPQPQDVRSPQQQRAQPQQPPSPVRKSMFDFVSPFDALAAPPPPSQPTTRKKPVPPVNPSQASSNDESSIPTEERRDLDPKRQSVENLISEMSKNAPLPSPPHQHPISQETFTPETYTSAEPRAAPPKPSGPRTESPRGPPGNSVSPKSRQRSAAAEPPTLGNNLATPLNLGVGNTQRDGSPTPRSRRAQAQGLKKLNSPPSQPQTIIFDVSQPLESTQAPRDSVKSTAIALVKIEPVFLPGSTIGATSWIAYAMTRGRVRIISRSSGDRTLLQLPPSFPPTSSVIDMVVSGNRLAGVTSDGGFVVWELPRVIEDDVPANLLLCVVPAQGQQTGLKSVKWHPKQPDTLAVASENRIHLINVDDALRTFHSEPITHMDLHRVGQVFQVPSPIVGFAFDVPHYAIATISEDSTLSLWSIRDKLPFWHHKILGEGTPSSIDFLDGGLIIGRKNGTIFQLLSVMGKNVLSTVKFVDGTRDDKAMFGHVAYDSRIQTLWVANSRRESLIALRVCFETATPLPSGEEVIRGGYFEQVIEFTGPKPTIHFVILSPDTDPNGEEAHAACVAAKVPPGELALVAFVVHSTGVDQVLIRKEWFDTAVNTASSKLPLYSPPQQASSGPAQAAPPPYSQRPQQQQVPVSAPTGLQGQAAIARQRTPPSDEVELDIARDEVGRNAEPRGKANKAKGAPAYKDAERDLAKDKGKEPDKGKAADLGPLADSPVAATLTKEIRKVEENLHTRIGRLIGKELERQQNRLDDIRKDDQRNEFERQQTVLKLISTELTKNTTRVVESAVRSEVQTSVLPALEKMARDEVRLAMNDQISKGLTESVQQMLPSEFERLLLRPDVSNHVARTFSAAITPAIEKHVMDVISNTLIPAYSQKVSNLHQELSREIHNEILNMKKDVIAWQSEALRGQDGLLHEMELSIRSLSEQVKMLSLGIPGGGQLQHGHQNRPPASPPSGAGTASHAHSQIAAHLRQTSHPLGPQLSSYASQSSYVPPPPAPQAQGWYPTPSLTSQATTTPPAGHSPSASKGEDWEEIFMSVLAGQDLRQLRELLARSNPEVILPSKGKGPLPQAVILTLIHRLATIVSDSTPGDEAYKSSLWWLQRTASALNTSDEVISPYIAHLIPNIQQKLTSARQRLILPGMPPQFNDTSRVISDIQDILNRKPLPSH